MTYKRFVERGRVALITQGPHKNKIVSIVDIIDQNNVVIDGPTNNVPRGKINLKQLQLTKFVAKYPTNTSSAFIAKTWQNAEIDSKWNKTAWAKKLQNKLTRAKMGDYDRFKLKKAKIQRNQLRKKIFFQLVKDRKAAIVAHATKKAGGAKKAEKVKKMEKK